MKQEKNGNIVLDGPDDPILETKTKEMLARLTFASALNLETEAGGLRPLMTSALPIGMDDLRMDWQRLMV